MWDQEIETNPVHAIQCSKDLNVPVVNVETFVRFIKALAEGEVETNTTFVPALDSPVVENGAVLPLAAVIQRLDVILNGGKSMLGLGDSVASERTPLWRCHVPFASSPVPGNLLSEAHTLWAQFLQHNALQPLSLLVAGPPRLGKTEAVKQLAQS